MSNTALTCPDCLVRIQYRCDRCGTIDCADDRCTCWGETAECECCADEPAQAEKAAA